MVDDGATDNSIEVVKEWICKYDNKFVQETGLHHRNTNPLHCKNNVQIEALFKKYNL